MMGVGYLGLFDRLDHTSSSEWDSREGNAITTLQDHHTAYPSDEGSRRLMDPGGRTVSANGLLLRDGTLVEVVPGQYRAYTSASSADKWSLTVETVNQTGPDEWGISEAQRRRLAKLHQDMARAGLPTTPGARGRGGLMGHNETPGSYPTACPGPSMHNDHIAALAGGPYLGDPAPVLPEQEEEAMQFYTINGGGLNGVSVAVWPGGFTVFESNYWRDRMMGRYDLTPPTAESQGDLVAVAAADLDDELKRLGIPPEKLTEHGWNVTRTPPVPGFGSWSQAGENAKKLDDILAQLAG